MEHTHHRLDPVKQTLVVQQTYRIARDQSAKGVSDNAKPFNVCPTSRQVLQCLLYLVGDALATELDPIVGETTGVALCDKYVELVFRILSTEGATQVVQMFGVSPEPGRAVSAVCFVCCSTIPAKELLYARGNIPMDKHTEVFWSLGRWWSRHVHQVLWLECKGSIMRPRGDPQVLYAEFVHCSSGFWART